MAFFIVIGTDNDVKGVVDEIKKTHLQHNVVTSGCILREEESLYYQWDVFNSTGDKAKEDKTEVVRGTIILHDALTNQISQFKTLLPDDAIPNVIIVSTCCNDYNASRLKMVYNSLCEIGGATLNNLCVDLVLIGYDLSDCENVTKIPDWKILRQLENVEKGGRFTTDVLYINNMDYDGAATNLDTKLLGRFISHWSTMISSGGTNPKPGFRSDYYAIGLAERQYNFEDLVPFFRLAAEERILDKTLHNPWDATRVMMDTNYYARILLDKPWISGLCDIRDEWKEYCTYEFKYDKIIEEQPHSLSVQIRKLSSYFNDWLKIFCQQQEQKKDDFHCRQKDLEEEIVALRSSAEVANTSENMEVHADKNDIESQIEIKEKELSAIKNQIIECSTNIEENTFSDYRNVSDDMATGLLTEKQRNLYEEDRNSENSLFAYIAKDRFVEVITETVNNICSDEETPVFPHEIIDNIGTLRQNVAPIVAEDTPIFLSSEVMQENRTGCLASFLNLFRRKKTNIEEPKQTEPSIETNVSEIVMPIVISAIKEYRKIGNVLSWWECLCAMIEKLEKRRMECVKEMEDYKPQYHQKSISLIDMDMVKQYRDKDSEYQQLTNTLVDKYFDSAIEINQRKTMPDLIDYMLIRPLREKWSILHWDETNPFCKEDITDDDIYEIIENQNIGTHKQSKPFVEYVKVDDAAIENNITPLFFFNHPKICKEASDFRKKCHIGSASLVPVFQRDFYNSLCEVQVLKINDYVDSICNFKPRTQAYINESKIDYKALVTDIVGCAKTPCEKAKAIYKWLCDNISYDVTCQIHDADTCWKQKCGVCQAYCELFYHLGKAVGLTVDIISGKSKQRDGKISEKSHAWVFVYTNGYDGIYIDPTWGAGCVSETGEFIKSDGDLTWFDVQPAWMIYTHFPDNKEWIKLEQLNEVLTEDIFGKLPFMEPSSKNGLECLNKDLFQINR